MASHMINLDDEAHKILKSLKDNMSGEKALSYSQTIKIISEKIPDTKREVIDNYSDLNLILLRHYNGDKEKAHISEIMKQLTLRIINDPDNYDKINNKLIEILSNGGK